MKYKILTMLCILFLSVFSQSDTTKEQRWNVHFQLTTIAQYHPEFSAKYSGDNSLQTKEGAKVSITSTLFFGLRLWKGAELYFNPEIAGGAGFSKTLGAAGFPNGETFRVGSPEPSVYIARTFLRQYISLSKETEWVDNDANQLHVKRPKAYVSLLVGRINIADYFDNNSFAHDARSQFMNWALMANGAWDYPANTRGYTYGFVAEVVKPRWALRYGITVVPKEANASDMNFNLSKASSHVLEAEANWKIKRQKGIIRVLGFATMANMGNYKLAAAMDTPDITATRKYSRTKFGFGINVEQNITDNIGVFAKYSWNDGRNETWMFTEIDQAFSAGISVNGSYWKRKNDVFGASILTNGISKAHRTYLEKGGYGFIIGDGKLNYAPEFVAELYYSFDLWKQHLFISPDFQVLVNPAYNKDRGPITAFGLRVHAEF